MTKDEVLAKLQASIDEHQAKLEELKQQAIEESQEALQDIEAAIQDLEPKLEQAKAKALEIADIADDAWDDVKQSLELGFEQTSEKLETGLSSIAAKIKSFFA